MNNNRKEVKNVDAATLEVFHSIIPSANTVLPEVKTHEYLRHGIIFLNKEGHFVEPHVSAEQYSLILKRFSVSDEYWYYTFHKSIDKVKNSTPVELAIEQITHYFSTYGAELVFGGIFANRGWVPYEKIFGENDVKDLPKQFMIIWALTEDQFKEKFINYLTTLTSPSEAMWQNSFAALVQKYANDIDIDNVKSFEIKSALYCALNIVPSDPVDGLRTLVYITTEGNSLLIKNRQLIKKIKDALEYVPTIEKRTYGLLKQMDLTKLASIFYRYKPIFLAFKESKDCAPIINKIRRLAPKYHKPLQMNSMKDLNLLFSRKEFEKYDKILEKANLRSLIKYYNFLSAVYTADSRIYNIRNNTIYVDTEWKLMDFESYRTQEEVVRSYICQKVKHKLSGINIALPQDLIYAAPISEKQMLGPIPYGSRYEKRGETFEPVIAWNDLEDWRVDLDLHLSGAKGHDYGWNCERAFDGTSDVLYSGDTTSGGAPGTPPSVEAFLISDGEETEDEIYLLNISNYMGVKGAECNFTFLDRPETSKINSRKLKNRDIDVFRSEATDAMVDMKNVRIPPIHLKLNGKRSISLGLYDRDTFYFYGGQLSDTSVPRRDGLYEDFVYGILRKCRCCMELRTLLELADANIFFEGRYNKDKVKIDIDLSVKNLTETTLLELIDKLDEDKHI